MIFEAIGLAFGFLVGPLPFIIMGFVGFIVSLTKVFDGPDRYGPTQKKILFYSGWGALTFLSCLVFLTSLFHTILSCSFVWWGSACSA